MSHFQLEKPLDLYRGALRSEMEISPHDATNRRPLEEVVMTKAFLLESNEVICGYDEIVYSMAKHVVKQKKCDDSDSYNGKSHWLSFSTCKKLARKYMDYKNPVDGDGVFVQFNFLPGEYEAGPFEDSFMVLNAQGSSRLIIVNANKAFRNNKALLLSKMGSECYDMCRSYSSESQEWLVGVLGSNSCLNWEVGEIWPSEYWEVETA